jgi:hypothetical protein
MPEDVEVIVGDDAITVTIPTDDLVVTVDDDADFEIFQSSEDDFDITLQTVSSTALTISLYARLAIYVKGEYGSEELLYRYTVTDQLVVPADLTGSGASASAASTTTVTFSYRKNGVEFGTAIFTSSDTATHAGAGTTLIAGDILTLHAPVAVDTDLVNIALTLAANRVT